jgi:hypothetical protein
VATELSAVNDHEQDVRDEENDDEGPWLPPPFTQHNDIFKRDRQYSKNFHQSSLIHY